MADEDMYAVEWQSMKDRIAELEEAIQKWYDYGYNRGEAEKLLEGE